RVGQGDATIIQGPIDTNGDRVNVLFDAGDISNRDGGRILRAVLSKRGITKLDYVIVSHYDADHIGGLVSGPHHGISFLLGWDKVPGSVGDDDNDNNIDWVGDMFFQPDPEEFGTGDDIKVDHFVDRGDASNSGSQAYRKYKLIAETHPNKRISLTNLAELEQFEIDLGSGAKMTALAANGFVRGLPNRVSNVSTENERSLSFLVSYDQFDFLISGDLIGRTSGGENAKIEREVGHFIKNQDIVVDVLHANHHGANNGSEREFLEEIKPIVAIVSAGNGNNHKHPHKNALKRLVEAGVYRIIQTSWGTTTGLMPENVRDIQAIYQGDIVISSNGTEFTISTSRKFETDFNPND
ncbi:MAG: MBL fold metallo-hydrolase, partial [Bacteroidia bacterium]|nr:MBL fold metallo-hydrolase [Bacteroidia bacterium]